MAKSININHSNSSIISSDGTYVELSKNGVVAVIVGYESFDNKQLKEWTAKTTKDGNIKATQILQKNKIALPFSPW